MISWLMVQPLWFVLLVWVATLFGVCWLVSIVCECVKQVVAAKQLRILQESFTKRPEYKYETRTTTRKENADD